MRKLLFFLTISFGILSIVPLQAKENGVGVRPVGRELIETEPRQIITTAFRVSNQTSEKQEFVPSIKLPQRWRLITREFPFELGPHQSDIRLVSFFIPGRTLAGKYEITYLVKERKYPSISDFYAIVVVVLPVRKLEVKLLEAPEYVIAGEDYQSSFTVISESNIATLVSLKIESGENWPFTVDSEKLQNLEPGESKTVVITAKTEARISQKIRHRLKLSARIAGFKDEEARASASSWVEIIPRITGVKDPFHRVPVEVSLEGVMQKDESGFQIEISGSGTLDEEGKRYIDFLFRGPDIQDKSILGERNEYRLSFRIKDYGLHLGDRGYFLSPLTQLYRYGRGIEGKLNLSNLTLGAYYVQSRWFKPETEETAAYINYLINEKYKLGLNYLKKRPTDSQILSLRGELELSKNTNLDLEYARGKMPDKEADDAYWLKLSGYQGGVFYKLTAIHGGPDYPGYYRDMDLKSGSLIFPLGKNLRFNAHYREEKGNLRLDPSLYSASRERYYHLGLTYRFESGTSLSFSGLNRQREDRLPEPKFDYQEDALRLGLGHSFKRLSLYSSAEWGKTQDKLTAKTYELVKYGVSARFIPSSRQSYSGYLQYSKDGSFSGEKRSGITAGLGTSFSIADKTFFNLDFRTDKERNNFELKLSHLLTNGNKISLRAGFTSYRDSNGKDETTLMVGYTIPFELPVSRKRNVGILKGRVYGFKTGEGITDVILRLHDATAVTDKQGNFIFPSLKPGTYYLNVDATRIGLDKITVQKTPMQVTVEDGKESWVEIGITQSAALFGQIMVYDFLHPGLLEEKRELAQSYGLANVLLEITNGSEIKRRVTNKTGRFRFEEVRPGEWTLKIYDTNLPEHHYFEKDTFKLELKPGEKKEILVKVLPKERSIRIIEKGGILLEEDKN